MGKFTLEVCVDSVESALAAVRGGADRLELCGNLIIGGTTPDAGLFEEIRQVSDIRTYVLIRSRYGDFCYSDYEFRVMARAVRQAGIRDFLLQEAGRKPGYGENATADGRSRRYVGYASPGV